MAKPAWKKFDERMFSGNRVAGAIEALGITQEEFLNVYNSVEIERSKPSDKIAALEAQIQALQAKLEGSSDGEAQAA